MDLTAAYSSNVSSLSKLTRTFTYTRGAIQRVTVEDNVIFRSPTSFESALTAHGQLQLISGATRGVMTATANANQLAFSITASAPIALHLETLSDYNVTFPRLGVKFVQPILSGFVRVEFGIASSAEIASPE